MLISRKIRSSPYRDTAETWSVITQLLTKTNAEALKDLEAVAGIASSCIADQAPKSAPIIVTCDGPRTKIYCLYDEDALDQGDFNEDILGYDPLSGDWAISLPCTEENLGWVNAALQKRSKRISARDLKSGISEEQKRDQEPAELTLNLKGFLGK